MAYRGIVEEDDEMYKTTSFNAQAQAQAQARRKGIGTRVWLVVSDTGHSHVEEAGKHSIMRRTGLPARDLRVLDPMLTYPSSILGRERAIVVNLEHMKAIITAKEVLMVNSNNPLVVEFVEDLKNRISSSNGAQMQKAMGDSDAGFSNEAEADWRSMLHDDDTSVLFPSKKSLRFRGGPDTLDVQLKNSFNKIATNEPLGSSPKPLPFEFRALEGCLESACRCLESETRTLEQEAYPALDELTSQISTLNLERVRQIKSRLVAISGRVQKVRDELEHLLDDDNDMAEMYLTEKLCRQTMDRTFTREESDNALDDLCHESDESPDSERESEPFANVKPNVQELEMLLEAYFVQIDGVSQKLSTMSEYVDGTEDYINIMLDDKQNQLLQMGVMLSTANMIINAGIVVVGIFGMNIHIELFDGKNIQFVETVLGTVGGCVTLFLLAVGWGKKRSLLAL